MLENCKQYLKNNYFQDIQFISTENKEMFFLATDTEDNKKKIISFDISNTDNIIVSVRHNMNDPFYILETISIND